MIHIALLLFVCYAAICFLHGARSGAIFLSVNILRLARY